MKHPQTKPSETYNYEVRERGDGVWCIYMRQYNVVVAEFSKGCASAVQEIKAILDALTGCSELEIKAIKKKSKTCRWKWIEKWSGSYKTTCRRFFSFDGYEVDTNAYKFCPGCGRKIEIRDEEEN